MQSPTSFLLGLSLSCLCAVSFTPESPISSIKAFSARLEADPGHALTVEDELHRANDGLFYVNGLSEKQSFKFLVDTGATHVVLSHSDAKRLTLSRLETADGQHVETVSGPAKVDWVIIKEVEIEGRILKSLRAAVPSNDIAVSLLGQNALAQFQAIQISGDELKFVK